MDSHLTDYTFAVGDRFVCPRVFPQPAQPFHAAFGRWATAPLVFCRLFPTSFSLNLSRPVLRSSTTARKDYTRGWGAALLHRQRGKLTKHQRIVRQLAAPMPPQVQPLGLQRGCCLDLPRAPMEQRHGAIEV